MNWYCIHTKPQRENSIRQYLEHFVGIEIYFPKLRESRVVRRVRRVLTRPLFPRYLFCRMEPALHYRAVRYAPEVIDIVHSGHAPAIVADDLIGDIKSWAGNTLDHEVLQPAFCAGDVVVIEEGLLMGLRAVVQHQMSDSERVAVLLSLLDCGARSVVPRSQLRLVANAHAESGHAAFAGLHHSAAAVS